MPENSVSTSYIGSLSVGPEHPVRVMAILNASPESFYSGSVASGRDAVRLAVERLAPDADLLDIGAMSTAPYKETQISEKEEADRMGLAVAAAREVTGLPVTADTQRSAVARVALEAGADGINDVSGLQLDPEVAHVVNAAGKSLIVMASERPGETAVAQPPVNVALGKLRVAVARAGEAGIARERLIVDPGVGFFRTQSVPWYEFDMALLRNLSDFHEFGLPVLISASRKSFIGRLLEREGAAERLPGSLAIAAHAARTGVHMIRTHDPSETRDVLRMTAMLEE